MQSVILSGGGAYADPWHPFAETSRRLAAILCEIGHEVEISEAVAARVTDLDGVDLLVVNASDGPLPDATATARGLAAHLARGGGVLAVHVGVCTLAGMAGWAQVSGAAWIDGVSMHPPLGPGRVRVVQDGHSVVGPLTDFVVVDEFYCHLDLRPDLEVLAEHELDGRRHPLVWARGHGRGRVVADALGHDTQSYDSPAHRMLLARAAAWLTERPL